MEILSLLKDETLKPVWIEMCKVSYIIYKFKVVIIRMANRKKMKKKRLSVLTRP